MKHIKQCACNEVQRLDPNPSYTQLNKGSLNTFAKGGKRRTSLIILPPRFSPSCFGQSKFLH